jgi:translation elongation factor EF-1alpha
MQRTVSNRQLNIVILGHADVGKSSLCGRIMLESGQLTEREISKYK